MVVYKITNNFNNKVYIGITTKTIVERMKNHKNSKDGTKLHNAIKKHGWENFKYEIIYEAKNKEELCLKEIENIELYDSYKNGYNSTTGGEVSPMLFENNKIKLSNTLKTKLKTKKQKMQQIERLHNFIKINGNPRLGKKHSEETKRHLSELKKGNVLSQEIKDKIIISSKNRKPIIIEDVLLKKTFSFLSIRQASKTLNIGRTEIKNHLEKQTIYKGRYIIKKTQKKMKK